jgi:hypothetical protein
VETIPSTLKSVLPVDTPPSLSPVGNLTISRVATAVGPLVNRPILPPTVRSPTLLPDHPSFTSGYSLTMPPPVPLFTVLGALVKKSGRESRSMRVRSDQAPKSSALSPRPTAKVAGNVEISEKPWPSSMLVR